MAHLLTPSHSFPSSDAIGVSNGHENLTAVDDGGIIAAKNRLVIRKHEPVPKSTIHRILVGFRTLCIELGCRADH